MSSCHINRICNFCDRHFCGAMYRVVELCDTSENLDKLYNLVHFKTYLEYIFSIQICIKRCFLMH